MSETPGRSIIAALRAAEDRAAEERARDEINRLSLERVATEYAARVAPTYAAIWEQCTGLMIAGQVLEMRDEYIPEELTTPDKEDYSEEEDPMHLLHILARLPAATVVLEGQPIRVKPELLVFFPGTKDNKNKTAEIVADAGSRFVRKKKREQKIRDLLCADARELEIRLRIGSVDELITDPVGSIVLSVPNPQLQPVPRQLSDVRNFTPAFGDASVDQQGALDNAAQWVGSQQAQTELVRTILENFAQSH